MLQTSIFFVRKQQERAAPGVGNKAVTVTTLSRTQVPGKTRVVKTHQVPRSEPKGSSGATGRWCVGGGPGKTDQAGLLTPINNFYVCRRYFLGSYCTVSNGGIRWMNRKPHRLP